MPESRLDLSCSVTRKINSKLPPADQEPLKYRFDYPTAAVWEKAAEIEPKIHLDDIFLQFSLRAVLSRGAARRLLL